MVPVEKVERWFLFYLKNSSKHEIRHAGSQLSRLLSRKQVRPDDQSGYPKDTIESFVGHSSMGLLCPPADTNDQKTCLGIKHSESPENLNDIGIM